MPAPHLETRRICSVRKQGSMAMRARHLDTGNLDEGSRAAPVSPWAILRRASTAVCNRPWTWGHIRKGNMGTPQRRWHCWLSFVHPELVTCHNIISSRWGQAMCLLMALAGCNMRSKEGLLTFTGVKKRTSEVMQHCYSLSPCQEHRQSPSAMPIDTRFSCYSAPV
ncbi:hypothetical protein VUR80DRAFT_4233 [Thermomyces stellatus]